VLRGPGSQSATPTRCRFLPLRSSGLAPFYAALKDPTVPFDRGVIRMRRRILVLAMLCTATTIVARAEGLRVLGAGSLREVIGEVGARYRTATGIEVSADFGPSGLVRERIEKGRESRPVRVRRYGPRAQAAGGIAGQPVSPCSPATRCAALRCRRSG
jgi:Bacterial extracellular solute-binding protein